MRGVVFSKSLDFKRVQDPSSVFNREGKENGGEGGKKGYIYSSFRNFLVQSVLLVNEHNTAQRSSYTTNRHLMNEEPRDKIVYTR
jgi:hypothetical protein